jgi:2-keto-4-pentenoate hydratase
MQHFNAQSVANWLVHQHATQTPFNALPRDMDLSNTRQAVAVQNEFVRIKAQQCGHVIGWKIALATPAMQKMVGLDAPTAGRLHSKQVLHAPADVSIKGYGRLLIEFEIAIQIGQNLLPSGIRHTGQSVASAVSAITCAFEVADDRQADYSNLGGQGLQLLADNTWNEGAVLGEWVPFTQLWPDLSAKPRADDVVGELKGEAYINGASVGHGYAHDLMGHPLNAIAWLANEANDRGTYLKVGDIAMLGSLVTSKFPQKGDHLRFELGGFKPIHLHVK